MIRPLMTKKFFLRQSSEDATANDVPIAIDLVDTLEAHRATCVGMAANMIGQRKRIIAFVDEDGSITTMLNPRIVHAEGEYRTQEGCLSLEGMRDAVRFERIEVEFDDLELKRCIGSYSGFVAQTVQHEIDHCNGVLI